VLEVNVSKLVAPNEIQVFRWKHTKVNQLALVVLQAIWIETIMIIVLIF